MLADSDKQVKLIIGYGSELRGDDGVGPRLARAVAGWALSSVRACAVHQLTPELAAALAEADGVLFIDATAGGEAPELVAVEPGATTAMGHAAGPATLLALTTAAYGRCPAAALLKVPVQSFHFSTELSAAATAQMEKALEHVRRWIEESTSKQAEVFQKVPW